MKVYVNSVTGTYDAITSLRMSKRTWTYETEQTIKTTKADFNKLQI